VHYQRGEATSAVEKAVAARDTGPGVQTGARATLLSRLGLEEPLEESELDQLHQNLRSSWWLWTQTFASCLLAEAYARAGRPNRGLAVLAEIPEHSLETVYSSEIYRCRGELLLSQGHAHALEAENCFRTAAELASRGGRRSLEIRAATSLSRLLAERGHREEARRALGDVYGWFTEGFGTADLREAKGLLDELS
jgi:predicted ATPase